MQEYDGQTLKRTNPLSRRRYVVSYPMQALISVNFNCSLKCFAVSGEESSACCKVTAEEADESW